MTSGAWNVPTWRAIFFPERSASPFSADLAVLRTLNRPILWLDLDKHQHIRGELHRYSDGAIFAALEGLRQNNAVPGDTEIAFFETPFQTVSAMRHIHPKEWVSLEGQITRIDPPLRGVRHNRGRRRTYWHAELRRQCQVGRRGLHVDTEPDVRARRPP